jgi:shikimate kinase
LINKQTETSLAVVRDTKNTVVALGGQAVAPTSSKVYWNKETEVVYIDAAGLAGMDQVWVKLNPFTHQYRTLDNFDKNNSRIFLLCSTGDVEAFGITLEPAEVYRLQWNNCTP